MLDQQLDGWLLPIADDVIVAIGRYELKYIEYLAAEVGYASAKGARDFFWRGRYIPVLDVATLAEASAEDATLSERIVAIVAYEDIAGNLLMGAIFLVDIPQMVHINSSQCVAVELLPHPWPSLAHAAFSYQHRDYPVLNLSALFIEQCAGTRLH